MLKWLLTHYLRELGIRNPEGVIWWLIYQFNIVLFHGHVITICVWTGPSCDDLEAFVSYLIQLVHGCDLERVGLLLRYVQRFVTLTFLTRPSSLLHVIITQYNMFCFPFPSPPVGSIWAMMIVWRLGGKIIRTVLCCLVYNSCAQWYTQMWTVFRSTPEST